MLNSHKRIIAAGLSLALIGAPVVDIFAAPSQAEVNAAKKKMEDLARELDDLEAQVEQDEADLQELQYNIDNKQKEIDKLASQLQSAKDVLARRMRSTYKAGNANVMQVLLGSTDFSDLVSRIYYMDKISDDEASQIAKVKDLESQVASEKADLEGKKKTQEKKLADQQKKAEALDAKERAARENFNKLDKELQDELRRQAEERRRAEEEAARRAQANQRPSRPSNSMNDIVSGGSSSGSSSNSSSSSGSGGSSSTSSPTKPSGGGLATAYSCIGKPYVWGATGPQSFDCSGLVVYSYGYAHGRTTYAMIASLKASGRWKSGADNLAVGDLVFPHSGHVGIYIGNGQMIHAPRPGKSVQISSIWYRGSVLGGGTY